MRRTDRMMHSIAGLSVALLLGGSIAWGAEPDHRFAASSGLFEIALPADWQAAEHADGGGVRVSAPGGDVTVELTFIPRAVLHSGGLRMGAPAGAGPMAIAETIAVLIPPAAGVEAAEPAMLELADGAPAVELAAIGDDVEGALIILEPSPGVALLASVAATSGAYTDVREMALELLGSLVFSGSEDDLMGLLDPPPLVDIALG